MGDAVILKHIRECRGVGPLDQLEIELRLNRQLTNAAFCHLERQLASAKWDSQRDVECTDRIHGDIRITDSNTAMRKRRIQVTDAGHYRVVTSQEQPIPLPPNPAGVAYVRHKRRRERRFWGWIVSLTEINPEDLSKASYEVEVELDVLFLVRRPPELLAKVGAGLMEDIYRLTDTPAEQ